jgi:hypothetical protein
VTNDVLGIVRAGQRRALGDTEVRLDGVESGSLGRRPHWVDAEPPEQRQESRMIVDVVQIIHDDEQPAPGITPPQATEGVAHVGHPLAPPEHTAETVGRARRGRR